MNAFVTIATTGQTAVVHVATARVVAAAGGVMRSRSIAALVAVLVLVPAAGASADNISLRQVAQRTWHSFAAMTDRSSGLPSDVLNADGSTSVQTSTTNIGAYMWSAVTAHRLGFIDSGELVQRLSRAL